MAPQGSNNFHLDIQEIGKSQTQDHLQFLDPPYLN